MSSWKNEVIRSGAQTCYWLNYRFADGVKLTALDYVNDVMAADELPDSPFDAEQVETPVWHERWYSGHHEKSTGRYVSTTPRPERLSAATTFIAQSEVLTPVALIDHLGSVDHAERFALYNGLDMYADQSYFAGRLRGVFIASKRNQRTAYHTVLMFHRLQTEEYFRVRDVSVAYKRRENESDEQYSCRFQSGAWDRYNVNDGWAATGTEHGSVFFLGGEGLRSRSFSIDQYKWDKKSNRILHLNANGYTGSQSVSRFQLCQKPEQILLSLDVLRSVSESMGLAHAAQ